jgi:hypothetical protein
VRGATLAKRPGGSCVGSGVKLLLPALLLASACGAATATSPPAAPTTLDDDQLPTMMTCWNGGDVLYRETTRTIGARGAPAEVLTVYESGAWRLEGRREQHGCLSGDEVAALEEQLRVVRRQAPGTPHCASQPTRDTLVEVPGVGALSYRWPCAQGPDEETATGIEAARDLTWRRG